MTNLPFSTPDLGHALDAAKEHATTSWYTFTRERNFTAIVPDWRTSTSPSGQPMLTCQVVGPGAANALHRFVADYHLHLANAGDVRQQFDYSQPGRTGAVWRYSGVWVELWVPDTAPTTPEVSPAPAPAVSLSSVRAAARRSFLRPSGRLPFTRKNTTKETTTR